MTITQQIERIKEEICNKYCKWPEKEPPEGKTEEWLYEDEDGPCNSCPFNQL